MAKSITKNYLYNLLFQMITLITPLITTPYISRVLRADGIGQYSYTLSIVTYFILFGTFGTNLYAQRAIAYIQDNRKQQSKVFWEIICIRSIALSISMLLFYFMILKNSSDKYYWLYFIQSLNIIANGFDITWYFQGLENFSKIVVRNIFVKVIGIFLIFILVKNENDLWLYALCHGLVLLVGHFSLWPCMNKYLVKVKIQELELTSHLPVIFQMFIPQIAMQIYTVLDKTMIGLITGSDVENGYYEQSQKVVKIFLSIVTSLGTVMIPRMANAFIKNEIEQIKFYLQRSFRFIFFLGIPIMLGLIIIADDFVPWFFGNGYEQVVFLIKIFSGSIMAVGLSNVIGMQYLIPTGKQKIFTVTVVIGALINFVLNILLISSLKSTGAAIASVIAETVITLIQFIYIRKVISVKEILNESRNYFIGGIVMLLLSLIVGNYSSVLILNIFVTVIIEASAYFFLLFLLKDLFFQDLLHKVKKIFKIR